MRGLYSGGTFCYEASALLGEALGEVWSNAPVDKKMTIADVWKSRGHTVIDLGDDVFTRGRPHPMIDLRLRNERILEEAADPAVAVILLDVVLGYGSHADPAAEIVPAVLEGEEGPHARLRRLGLRHRRGSAGPGAAGVGAARGRRAARRQQRARGRARGGHREAPEMSAALLEAAVGPQRRPRLVRRRDRGPRRRRDAARVGAAGGRRPRRSATALARLLNHPAVEKANATAADRYLAAQPRLVGIGVAREVLPGMGERMLLHAGPPIAWARMCGPMQGAIVGAILYEGWADSAERARAMAEAGDVAFAPCHHHAAVGPMAGIISPSMPVWMVENPTHGNRAYCNLNEGLGKVLRFGANSSEVLERLKWMERTLAPVLRAGLEVLGEVELKPLMAQALHMGDEVHNRNAAASSLLLKRLVPALLKSNGERGRRRGGDRVHRRQRPFLPQHLDGRLQGDARRRARRRQQHHGHRDGAQRRRIRHPRQRAGRALVHRAGAGGQRPATSRATPSPTRRPTWATARSPRPPGSAASPWRRRRRSSSSSAARRRTRSPTRWR